MNRCPPFLRRDLSAIRKGITELERVMALVKAEAAKGNRDLEGTGLNKFPGIYNN